MKYTKREYTPAELRDKAAAYCSTAEHCLQEVREKLRQWGCERDEQAILDYLVDEGFVSHPRYAQAFVHDKLLYQHWGRRKLQTMLAAKKIERSIIAEAMNTINETEYHQVLTDVAKKKIATLRGDNLAHDKYLRFMLGRGFEFREAETVLAELKINLGETTGSDY